MIYQPKDEVEKCTFEIQIIVIKSNSPLGMTAILNVILQLLHIGILLT